MSIKLLNKYINCLINEAQKSTIHSQLAAGILKNQKMITKPCCNIERNICRGYKCTSIHAEVNAMLNFFGKNLQFDNIKNQWYLLNNYKKTDKLNLIVIRITKDGKLSNSRPCINCLNMMKDLGIKKIYYTSGNNNELICENVKDMISIQISYITLYHKNNKIDKKLYFENLIKKSFPKYVKEKNLLYFINYNFINIFPTYKINYNKNKVTFLDLNNILIVEIFIIN
jgi:deoxycytidylate deaminase